MYLTYQYRLNPSKTQHRALETLLHEQRVLYNAALQERIEAYRRQKKNITLYEQQISLTELRQDHTFASVPANVQRWTLRKLDEAMKAFFDRAKSRCGKAGFPRFRSSSRWSSFGFAEFRGIRIRNQALVLKGIPGSLRVNWHRDLPPGCSIKSSVFTRDHKGWKVSFQLKVEAGGAVASATALGVDVGLSAYATCSDGNVVPNPRIARRAEKELRRRRRALARCKRGSTRRRKVKLQLTRASAKVTNTRKTWLHQQSSAMVTRADVLVFEDLAISNMVRNPHLARSISDAGWGEFMAKCAYKAERAGKRCIQVKPHGTSQRCAGCGEAVQKLLSDRVHTCPVCGFVADRDLNAAWNIVSDGLSLLRRENDVYEAVVGLGLDNVGGYTVRPAGNINLNAHLA